MGLHGFMRDIFTHVSSLQITVKVLYFAVFPMNVISLKFNFVDFVFLILLQCTAKMLAENLISRKQFIREIREIYPRQNFGFYSILPHGENSQ